MLIGLYNLEPKIVNTAMMQVSTYHKALGHNVEIYNPLRDHEYDKVYAFSIFKDTQKSYVKKSMVKGGTGFDVSSKLPELIEQCGYDWSLYPRCDYSIVWFSRGCIRSCPFCVVSRKEGNIRSVEPMNLNPNGTYIKVTDNNFFANPNWRQAIKQLKEWNQKVDFQCGLDVRIFTEEQGEALKELKLTRLIHIAWDNPKEDLRDKIKLLTKYVNKFRIICYILIGYWSTPEEDLYRVMELRKLKIDAFVMPFNKKDKYQRDFARWVNHKAIFKSVDWKDYKKTNGGKVRMETTTTTTQFLPSLKALGILATII